MAKAPALTTDARLKRLKAILQDEISPAQLENLAAALIGAITKVGIAVAKSGFQSGGDAGPAGRQGRRFRIETKRYADTTSLSDRELQGEVDDALSADPALEAWFLVATRAAPEQLELKLLKKSNELGVPIIIIDWKLNVFPALAALCTAAPEALATLVSTEAADLARDLQVDGASALVSLTRDIESWYLGFERLRSLSILQLQKLWTTPCTSAAVLGQDAAGGHYSSTIRRASSFAALSQWWSEMTDAPAAVVGWEGVGKTWATLDWLANRRDDLPIVLVVPSGSLAGFKSASISSLKDFIAERFHELTQIRDLEHWRHRLDRLLRRPIDEGPILTIFLDGLNQEPSTPWAHVLRVLQDEPFAGRVRVVVTTRNLHMKEKLGSLRGLVVPPKEIAVDVYDDQLGGELDQRLAAESLTRADLHEDLIRFARTPRLFRLVIRFHERLTDAGQVTVHRLLWEYGRDTLGTRAGKSFSEDDWRSWLQDVAQRHIDGFRKYNMGSLGETTARPDLSCNEVFLRLSDIIDAQFAIKQASGQLVLSPTLVAHALGAALLNHLDELGVTDRDKTDLKLAQWLDPISGLDERAEILRAAVSIVIERDSPTAPAVATSLVSEWLRSQNIPDEHRTELTRIAAAIPDPLLETVSLQGDGAQRSARTWAVNALRAIPKTDTELLSKIISHATNWLKIISRDVDHSAHRSDDSEKVRSSRFIKRLGVDSDGPYTVLGSQIQLVERRSDEVIRTIPSLLEGFPLVSAAPVFEATALVLAIRGRCDLWDSLKWLCLLNNEDFTETAAELRLRSRHTAAKVVEQGIHPELPLRVAALLLWLSGDEDDEAAAAKLNPSLDHFYSYDTDYANDPGQSLFRLERRHAEQVLLDANLTLRRKIDRTKAFWVDPNFSPPAAFVEVLREGCLDFEISALDSSRSQTVEDHAFSSLAPVLARCAPDLLARLLRAKIAGFAHRPPEQRLASAIGITEQLLLVDDACAESARLTRLKPQELNDDHEATVASQLLLMEIQQLSAQAQIIAVIEADLPILFRDFAEVLKPLTADDTDALVDRYIGGATKQIEDLIDLLLSTSRGIGERTWQWLGAMVFDPQFKRQTEVFKLLATIDEERFGRMLGQAGWRWHADNVAERNHFGSLALIAATKGLPFEQIASSVAPWLLLKAVRVRGASAADAQIAAELVGAILRAPQIQVPDPGSYLSVYSEHRKQYPFSISMIPKPVTDDPFEGLRDAMDAEKQHADRRRAVDTAVERIRTAHQAGANLYLHDLEPDDLAPIVEHVPTAVNLWIEGANVPTADFKRRVRLAEGLYLALCEALLIKSPHQGAMLWRALGEALITRFVGVALIEEMIHMLFRVPESEAIENLLKELVDSADNDQRLFEIAVAATVNGKEAWLDLFIQNDKASTTVWRCQRAQKLDGFKSGNSFLEVWPEGPEEDLRTSRANETAQWRHKEACARHWWNSYWTAECDESAYSAWILFMESADLRAYGWMSSETSELDEFDSTVQRRMTHANYNVSNLKSAVKKQENQMDRKFLGRRTVEGIGPWGKATG
jgi:hypothetical protein